MADTSDDIRASLEKQIGDLKKDIAKMSKSLSARASDAYESAEDAFSDVKGQATQVGTQLRRQASVAADVARENPATTATVLTTVGVLGLAAGLLLGGAFSSSSRR